ncbi:MAG: N-acetylmuramoyl-L-alanine amidase [Actinomycetota bacterium]
MTTGKSTAPSAARDERRDDARRPSRRRLLVGAMGGAVAVCCADHVAHSALTSAVDAVMPARAPDPVRPDSPRHRSDTPTAALDRSPAADTGSSLTGPEVISGLRIRPRDDWGADLPPCAAMGAEDVRFLLVHHTASPNTFTDPVPVMRDVYAFHTGRSKGWPDVAYNFFVGPDGSVWEGRAGSLAGPVVADATGGNQGFSQLVCLIGNFVATLPTPAAQESLIRVLAWLTVRHSLGVYRDASARFVSRGSDRFPAGSIIETPIVSPHRAVTFTLCPGDAAIALLPEWRRRVFDEVSATWERDGLQRADRVALEAP